jgi:hypothetical protein
MFAAQNAPSSLMGGHAGTMNQGVDMNPGAASGYQLPFGSAQQMPEQPLGKDMKYGAASTATNSHQKMQRFPQKAESDNQMAVNLGDYPQHLMGAGPQLN